jgi:hypothetical protein
MPARAYGHSRAPACTAGTALLAALMACLPPGNTQAAELYEKAGISLRWDTTIRYSNAFRVEGADRALTADPNSDDGDRNFQPGPVSNRLDVFSQAELDRGDFGLRLSGLGWFDSIYTERNDNNSPSTFNPVSVPHNAFTRATRALHAEHIELFDAYVHGSFEVGNTPVSFRLGRYTLTWGESLFFAENGIAAGQSPADVLKQFGNPLAQTAEILLPVTQAAVTMLPRPDLSIEAYYQFEWRKNRLPGSGSFFSASDILDSGGERLFLDGGRYLLRTGDLRPPGSDQFGAAMRLTKAGYDLGIYALRFDAKSPEIYLRPDGSPGPGPVGFYQLVYPSGIEIYGASFSSYLADSNIAGEISFRRNMPLVGAPAIVAPGEVAGIGADARYPVGNTLHAQISTVNAFPAGRFWDGAEFVAEIASATLLDIERNRSAFDFSRDDTAVSAAVSLSPEYFEVLPNLTISLPLAVRYGLIGDSATSVGEFSGAGDFEFGAEAEFKSSWKAKLLFVHFMGSPMRQPLGDRDFVSMSIQRTF